MPREQVLTAFEILGVILVGVVGASIGITIHSYRADPAKRHRLPTFLQPNKEKA